MWILSESFKCVLGEMSEADEVDTKAYEWATLEQSNIPQVQEEKKSRRV